MNKKIIVAAIAASFVAPAVAMAETTVYGKLRQALEMVDDDQGDSFVRVQDYASRLGFKGSEDLGNGLKGIYQIEMQLNLTGDKSDNSEFKINDNGTDDYSAIGTMRNTFVGLAGDFGTVLIGSHDHPVKMSTGQFDHFADSAGDNGNTYQAGADLRADGTVAYVSPSFSGLTAAIALVPGEDGSDADDGIADAWSAALMYSNGGLAVTAGYEEGDAALDGLGDNSANPDYEQTRFGIGYTMDAISVNLVYTDVENLGARDYESWKIGGKYTMGNNAIKAYYFDLEDNANANIKVSTGWQKLTRDAGRE